jgi:xylulokinase
VDKLLTWLRLTGGVPGQAGKDSIAHILFIKHELPEIYRSTYKFLEPKDYLNFRLTGKYAASYESITLHWLTDNRDLSRVHYHDRLIELSTLDPEKLPELKRAVDILGPLQAEAARELGLPEGIPVVMGTPDMHSAAIGSGAVQDFAAHYYVGTSSWLLCHVPFKKADILHGIASLPSAIPDRYLVTNEQETSGACLTYLRDNLFFPEDELAAREKPQEVYKVFDRLASQAPAGSGGLIFTPWLYGERTPVDDHLVRGGFFNLSLQTTRAHLIRAVLEGVAYNARWLLVYTEKLIRRTFDAINMIGGGANSDIWCQICADVFNRTIRQVADPIQANVRGTALLASVALGRLTFEQVAQQVQIVQTYHPDPKNRQVYDRLFKEFVGLYTRNRKAFSRINRASA